MRSIYTALPALCVLMLCLGACGIKPESVDPPQGLERDIFPRPYPSTTAIPVD